MGILFGFQVIGEMYHTDGSVLISSLFLTPLLFFFFFIIHRLG